MSELSDLLCQFIRECRSDRKLPYRGGTHTQVAAAVETLVPAVRGFSYRILVVNFYVNAAQNVYFKARFSGQSLIFAATRATGFTQALDITTDVGSPIEVYSSGAGTISNVIYQEVQE